MVEEPAPERVRMPRGKEMFGIAEATLGANKIRVRCRDSVYRICRIPGRFKKRIWIKADDVILMEPWDIQGDKFGDVVWKYRPAQAEHLRRKGLLNF